MHSRFLGSCFLLVSMGLNSACGPSQAKKTAREQPGFHLNNVCDRYDGTGTVVAPKDVIASVQQVYCLKLEWRRGPFENERSHAELTFTTPDLKIPASVQVLEVKPWMDMGIHSHTTRKQPTFAVRPDQAHVFDVDDILFTMSGRWQIQVRAIINGYEDKTFYEIDVPDA